MFMNPMNALPDEPTNSHASFRTKIGGLLGVVLLMGLGDSGAAGDGYVVSGHLTYTAYGTAGEPRTKHVLMFQVQMANGGWRIRTEPVVRGPKGIGYYEASGGTNDSVFALTAFQTAMQEAESPFSDLRAKLIETYTEAVFFTNPPPPQMPEELARRFAASEPVQLNAKPFSSQANNVAIATIGKGNFPPVSPSHIGFLWFAFTPPKGQQNGTKQLLLQIWDDGNPTKRRFRQASWRSFSEPPQLVSSADYIWSGWQLLEDGRQENLQTFDVSDPLATAARYEVITTTNLAEWRLPQHFKLTRYATIQTGPEPPRIVSTIVASTVTVRRFSPTEPLQVTVPGKTFVSDYRGPGARANYFLDSDGSRSDRP
jgi:hypothetical protein